MVRITPCRNLISDRFSVASFVVQVPPDRMFEVACATDPALFRADQRHRRTAQNFATSRVGGLLRAPAGQATYVLPSEQLRRFAGQTRIYYAVGSYRGAGGEGAEFSVAPDAPDAAPFIQLSSDFSGRTLDRGRLRGVPVDARYGDAAPGQLAWGGDLVAVQRAARPAARVGTAEPLEYDDGFDDALWKETPTHGGAAARPVAIAGELLGDDEPDREGRYGRPTRGPVGEPAGFEDAVQLRQRAPKFGAPAGEPAGYEDAVQLRQRAPKFGAPAASRGEPEGYEDGRALRQQRRAYGGCGACDGSEAVACPYCKDGFRNGGRCGACAGAGKLACPDCKGGERRNDARAAAGDEDSARAGGVVRAAYGGRCKRCDGERTVACHYCDGRDSEDCDRCERRGKVTCPKCDGSGQETESTPHLNPAVRYKDRSVDDYGGAGVRVGTAIVEGSGCTRCRGTGSIEVAEPCPDCDEDSWKSCKRCGGKTYIVVAAACPECGDRAGSPRPGRLGARVTCQYCGGSGRKKCTWCQGDPPKEGAYPCSGCGYRGTVKCADCHGEGKREEDTSEQVAANDGDSASDEDRAGNPYARAPRMCGKKTCTRCNGDKRITCSWCGGDPPKDGAPGCSGCGHRGTVKCPDCHGDGKVDDTAEASDPENDAANDLDDGGDAGTKGTGSAGHTLDGQQVAHGDSDDEDIGSAEPRSAKGKPTPDGAKKSAIGAPRPYARYSADWDDVADDAAEPRPLTAADRVRILDGVFATLYGSNLYDHVAVDDEAGLVWGAAGFSQAHGTLGEALAIAQRRDPAAFVEIFGAGADELLQVTRAASPAARMATVGGRPLGDRRWQDRFRAAGRHTPFCAAQREAADVLFFQPALPFARNLGLSSEPELAVLFDRCTHMGAPGGCKYLLEQGWPRLGRGELTALQRRFGMAGERLDATRAAAIHGERARRGEGPDVAAAFASLLRGRDPIARRIAKIHQSDRFQPTRFSV